MAISCLPDDPAHDGAGVRHSLSCSWLEEKQRRDQDFSTEAEPIVMSVTHLAPPAPIHVNRSANRSPNATHSLCGFRFGAWRGSESVSGGTSISVGGRQRSESIGTGGRHEGESPSVNGSPMVASSTTETASRDMLRSVSLSTAPTSVDSGASSFGAFGQEWERERAVDRGGKKDGVADEAKQMKEKHSLETENAMLRLPLDTAEQDSMDLKRELKELKERGSDMPTVLKRAAEAGTRWGGWMEFTRTRDIKARVCRLRRHPTQNARRMSTASSQSLFPVPPANMTMLLHNNAEDPAASMPTKLQNIYHPDQQHPPLGTQNRHLHQQLPSSLGRPIPGTAHARVTCTSTGLSISPTTVDFLVAIGSPRSLFLLEDMESLNLG
ncbi:hypothetical protein BD779DRAFT_1476015 [Infundibulicybe gibba]|nr:hypothetical protein BD779DRAFT_1476015 [Infundibulicybe gibba]